MRLPYETDRRTVLKVLGTNAVGSWALTGSAGAHHDDHHDPGPQPYGTPPIRSPTWGSDETDDWEIADTTLDEDREKTIPYTLIPQTGLSKSPHFPGHYDQVVSTAPQNKGSHTANRRTHNVFYDNAGHDHHNRPYNGKEVLTNSYEIVKDAFDFFLGKHGVGAIRDPDLVEVSPNDAPAGNDDYLNTDSQIDNATHGNSVGDPTNVPETSGSGDKLFPTEEQALPDGSTYGDLFGEGYFVAFTFVCPIRPTDTGKD